MLTGSDCNTERDEERMYNQNVYKYDDMKRKEHMAVRKTVGWYLWTHQLLEVTGEHAAEFLDKIFVNPIATLKVGRERYTTMLNEQAEIIDDVVVIRLEEQKFWISTLFITALTAWLNQHKEDYHVCFKNITEQYHMYAIQGPNAKDMINAMAKENIDEQKFFSIRDNKIGDMPVKINRAGFTGEKWGYEIYVAAEKAQELEDILRKVGSAFDAVEVTEFQIMAWALPTEAGFYYMRDLMHTNPLEVGLDKGIDWDKVFIGRDALLEIKKTGAKREMFGITVDEADVFISTKSLGGPGSPVFYQEEEIGRVSKFTYSYLLEKNIGYVLVEKGKVNPGDVVKVKTYDAVITEKAFLK